MLTSHDQLFNFNYTKSDKKLLNVLLSMPGLGRKTVAEILIYLKKHEVKNEDAWVKINQFLQNKTKYKKNYKTINKIVIEQKLTSILTQLNQSNIRVIAFWEEEYPKLLKQTEDFPLLLFVKGNIKLLQSTKMMAVVGTRKITSYGESVTKKLVSELTDLDYIIISGCMYGVDATAHQSAIENFGKTIAVLGYGFNFKTSGELMKLQDQIVQSGGCLVSEFFPDTQPSKGTFPQRNRIVAGMSLGVLVTEAALKSGSHITADFALDAGREVFAVPGSIYNPYSEGTKYLINQGGKLVSSVLDIVAELKNTDRIPSLLQKPSDVDLQTMLMDLNLDQQANLIMKELIYLPQTTNDLVTKTNLPIQELLKYLGMLELENIVENESGLWRCVLSYSGCN
jgi:DNA processing protein